MRSRCLIFLLATATVLGTGCNADKGNEQTGLEAGTGEVLTEPSATDQAETTTATIDSTAAVLLDSVAGTR